MRVKRKISKNLTIGLLVYAFLLVSVCAPEYCMASNWRDKEFEFENRNSNLVLYPFGTPSEAKEDDSSAYAYNDKSDQALIRVEVWGEMSATGVMSDCTYGSYKNLPVGQAYYFPNYVNENGYDMAFLNMYPSLSTFYIHLWWSPDSI